MNLQHLSQFGSRLVGFSYLRHVFFFMVRGRSCQMGKCKHVMSSKASTQNWLLSLSSTFHCPKQVKSQGKYQCGRETYFSPGGVGG